MTEKQVEEYLREKIKKMGGKAYKFVSPGNVGVPDRIVILPGGRIYFVELKSPTGKLSAVQIRKQDELNRLGCQVFTVRSKEGVDQLIEFLEGKKGVMPL